MSTSLGAVCTFINGGTPSRSVPRYFEGEIPWITGADIVGPTVVEARSFITEEAIRDSATNRVPAGTVLLVTRTSVGKVAIAGTDLCFSQDITALTPEPRKLDTGYLVQFLRTQQPHLERLARGATIRGVPREVIERLSLELPPLPEQRRIAEILDKADALKVKRRATLAQFDSLAQSIFLNMFGDPRENEKRWPKAQLGSAISDMRGGVALEPEDFVEEGFPILHKGAIKPRGKISIDSKKKTFALCEYAQANQRSKVNREFTAVTLRDLVPSGPSIGLAADLRKGPFEEYLLAQGAYGFRLDPEKLLPEFFVQLSNMPNFRHVLRQNAVGSTQIHIRTPIYLGITIPLPPVELQRNFARRVGLMEQTELPQLATLVELDGLFVSLQHRAFRGKL